jgi:hypothetical protein
MPFDSYYLPRTHTVHNGHEVKSDSAWCFHDLVTVIGLEKIQGR